MRECFASALANHPNWRQRSLTVASLKYTHANRCVALSGLGVVIMLTQGGAARLAPRRCALGWCVAAPSGRKFNPKWSSSGTMALDSPRKERRAATCRWIRPFSSRRCPSGRQTPTSIGWAPLPVRQTHAIGFRLSPVCFRFQFSVAPLGLGCSAVRVPGACAPGYQPWLLRSRATGRRSVGGGSFGDRVGSYLHGSIPHAEAVCALEEGNREKGTRNREEGKGKRECGMRISDCGMGRAVSC